MSRLYETSLGQNASPSPLSSLHAPASLLLHYTTPVLVRDGRISRWARNRARLVVTARGVHGRNRLDEGMRREGTVAVFPVSSQVQNAPVDAVPLSVTLI